MTPQFAPVFSVGGTSACFALLRCLWLLAQIVRNGGVSGDLELWHVRQACTPTKCPFMERGARGRGILPWGVSGCILPQTRGRTGKSAACDNKRVSRAVHPVSGRGGGGKLWRCPVAARGTCGAYVGTISRSPQPDNDPERTVQLRRGAGRSRRSRFGCGEVESSRSSMASRSTK